MTKKSCRCRKHISPIISQTADYYCYKNHKYMNWASEYCEYWEYDEVTLTEKEDKVW